ncbi:MAG: hypothetical protein ACTSO4_04820 [Promethearchaeota archaeon]
MQAQYYLPDHVIKLSKKEDLWEYSLNVNKYAPFGRDENGHAYFNIELRPNQTFEEYVEEIEKIAPFGRDQNGVPHLIPMRNPEKEIAWRLDMKRKSDWGKFHKSGIGWKLKPTLLIAIALFLPKFIGLPILNLIYGDINTFYQSIYKEWSSGMPYLLLILVLTLFIRYAKTNMEELIKPYVKNNKSIQMLFINELEYLKFSKQISSNVYNMKWLRIGGFAFIISFIGLTIDPFISTDWIKSQPAELPWFANFILIPQNILYSLIVLMILSLFLGIIVGLFSLANLTKDRSKLSIDKYDELIDDLNYILSISQKFKQKIKDINIKLNISGRTFYEFQRGNRKIGEFLFNITTLLILICISAGIFLWLIDTFNVLPESYRASYGYFYVIIFAFGVLSLAIFILPQFKIHRFLKEFKYSLVDKFSMLLSRFEYFYLEALKDPSSIQRIDENWRNRHDIINEINFIKEKIEEIKKYGTWSYDFPEVMKMVIVATSPILSLILPLLGIKI